MAEVDQEQDRGRESTDHNNEQSKKQGRRRIPGVNFDEMNFEQRRAPYNSGKRYRSEKDYGDNRDGKRPMQSPNDR